MTGLVTRYAGSSQHEAGRRPRPDGLDFLSYRTAVSQAVVALDVYSENPHTFRGTIDLGVSGDIHVLHVRADQHAVHRTPSLVGRTPDHYLKFSVLQEGSGFVAQDGREAALGPGDMVVYDTNRPYSLRFDDVMQMVVVMFPRALLGVPGPQLTRMTAVRYDGDSCVGQLVRPFLASLGREVTAVDGGAARRLYRSAVDMVQTLLVANAPRRLSTQDALLERIHDYIGEHLSEHDLDPTRIAREHFISVRHLHALFSECGATVSTVIRTRRLERCYDDLINPLYADRPVGTIAHGNGFVDAAHFSRSFRARYGVSPSSLRR